MNNKLAQIEIALDFAGIEYDDVIEGVCNLVKKHDQAIELLQEIEEFIINAVELDYLPKGKSDPLAIMLQKIKEVK